MDFLILLIIFIDNETLNSLYINNNAELVINEVNTYKEKDEILYRKIEKGEIPTKDGVEEVLKFLKENNSHNYNNLIKLTL